MFSKKKQQKEEKKKKEEQAIQQKRIQDLINVSDIEDGILYTKDNYLMGYISVEPVNISLLSNNEKRRKRDLLKEKLNVEEEFEFIKLSKSADLSRQINYLQGLARECDNHLKKMALLESIRATSKYSQQGEMVENQFYYIFRMKNNDNRSIRELKDKLTDFINKLGECEIKAYILNDMEVTQVCNLFCNPTLYSDEFELNEYVTSFV
ncbi:MAG: hypothetical protein ACLR3R_18525 [Clostridium paraputrificum]